MLYVAHDADDVFDISLVCSAALLEYEFQKWSKKENQRRGFQGDGVRVIHPITIYSLQYNGKERFQIPVRTRHVADEPLILSDGTEIRPRLPLSRATREEYKNSLDHWCAA